MGGDVCATNSRGTGTAPPILVVDDDSDLRRLVRDYLSTKDFTVFEARNVAEMREIMLKIEIEIVILDVLMHGESGLSAARSLLDRHDVGIIMVSALGSEHDRIAGLESGADDYLVKPVSPAELLARVRALRRRQKALNANRNVYEFNGWSLDTLRRVLRNPDGVIIGLSDSEFNLLLAFLEHPGTVMSRADLLELLHGDECEQFDRAVDTQISRLRRKLDVPGSDEYIRTVRGEGYIFEPLGLC